MTRNIEQHSQQKKYNNKKTKSNTYEQQHTLNRNTATKKHVTKNKYQETYNNNIQQTHITKQDNSKHNITTTNK